ncbi:MAG: flavin reductase [Anaerolineales bacterium]|nr:flavin reductase [Anaerolineales bacterium]
MLPKLNKKTKTAEFTSKFFPQHILVLSCGANFIPMGYWTVVSKEPFRFLICMQVGNHSLKLLREHKEAGLHFFPWEERDWIDAAGHLSGETTNKAEVLGRTLVPAEKLKHTKLLKGADVVFETVLSEELEGLSGTFALFVMDVLHVHGNKPPQKRKPIFYQSVKDFATVGETWKSSR